MGWFDWLTGKGAARSPKAFERLALEIARGTDAVSSCRRHPEEEFCLELRFEGSAVHRLNLHNLWEQVAEQDLETQRAGISHFLMALGANLSVPKSWEEARPRLRLALRGGATMLAAQTSGMSVAFEPWSDLLVAALYLDSEFSIAYVSEGQLEEWGVDRAQAFQTARENLTEASSKLPGPLAMNTLSHFPSTGDETSSYLLVPGWLKRAAGGNPVIAWASGRDSLTVLVHDGSADLSRFAVLAREEWAAAPRRISPRLMTVDDDGSVVPLEVPRDHPAFGELDHSRCVAVHSEYTDNKEQFEQWLAESGEDVFVASVMVPQEESGALFTLAVWPCDLPTLLPRVDEVAMSSDPADAVRVPWAQLEQHLEGFEPIPGWSPPRYRVGEWPDDDVLRKIHPDLPSKWG